MENRTYSYNVIAVNCLLSFAIALIVGFALGNNFGYYDAKTKILDKEMAKRLDDLIKPKDTTCVVEMRYKYRNKETHIWEGKLKHG